MGKLANVGMEPPYIGREYIQLAFTDCLCMRGSVVGGATAGVIVGRIGGSTADVVAVGIGR